MFSELPSKLFHPAVADWFRRRFSVPTAAQGEAWPAIAAGRHTLIAAPTGSGKTLAAFLAALDALVREGLGDEGLPDETRVLYVSPLKALSNDVHRNLEVPLEGISEQLRVRGLPEVDIRTVVRTGDTPAAERARMFRRPPHVLVTTPESLYILLGSASGRRMLATTRSVIVDEIHALAPNKRGVHLAVSLERLQALTGRSLQRVGLSATQKPIAEVARFLVGVAAGGGSETDCTIVDSGHGRARDLALEVTGVPLEAVMSNEAWERVYERLAELVRAQRTTLVFVNTRRLAERVTRHLAERLGDAVVAAHHGSLARDKRLDAEQRLKTGGLRALVATASLELGIDVGDVELVCQLGSPRSIAAFLQRVGRSGHGVGGTPQGRLFPLSRDELVECAALLDSVRRGELDRLEIPECPLDVLAQQIVAEAAVREWDEEGLYTMLCHAWPYRALSRGDFVGIVRMLAEGYTTRRGRRGALLHYDAINGLLRGRRNARLTALTSGGTIPDTADYQVLLEPENHVIGTVNEDFAVESLAGDIFQLGNSAYRIRRIERGTVRVEDAAGLTPNVPFWLGEAPGRSDELSEAVSRLRAEVARWLQEDPQGAAALRWLQEAVAVGEAAARQLVDYLAAGHAALGCLPTRDTIVFERFFDESGGMQLVIHSPFGSRVNRAWGLALRKRFCRKFNFELQAAATEDNIVLSLTAAHSFPLEEVARYLNARSARHLLIQALLDAPMFITRWRWVAGVALALPRFRGGHKVPPQFMRMDAEDLIAAVFPDQIACFENIAGEREVPDHPLVAQTLRDCLHEAMDVEGFECLLRGIESGEVRTLARDLSGPSPLAQEVLCARPYAFLDDAPLEERRTQAVMGRRWLTPESAADLGRLDPGAIERVRGEIWPDPANPDELHDALVWLGFVSEEEVAEHPPWAAWLARLADAGRVTLLRAADAALWVAAERSGQFAQVYPATRFEPPVTLPPGCGELEGGPDSALVEILRGRLEGLGPVTADELGAPLALPGPCLAAALTVLETEGFAMRGRYSPQVTVDQWCERRLLARIHRYTVQRLRTEVEPVAARDFMCFLFEWQRVASDARLEGPDSVAAVVGLLEGFEVPAGAWESEILPARIAGYDPVWLDEHCLAGRIVWTRLTPRAARERAGRGTGPVRTTPIALLPRPQARHWTALAGASVAAQLGSSAQAVAAAIRTQGALFFDELLEESGLLRAQLEDALAELVAGGLVNSDSFAGLRTLLLPADHRRGSRARRRRGAVMPGMETAGRWALTRRPARAGEDAQADGAAVEHVARVLLRRYGVVFPRVLEREATWLPPWRDLLRCYRRLEARGEIRGGRFVSGFSGEQFALPEAVGSLREARRRGAAGNRTPGWVSLSAADPLNLVGILTPGSRLPALTGNRVLYRDGLPVAVLAGGQMRFLAALEPFGEWAARNALLHGTAGAVPQPGS